VTKEVDLGIVASLHVNNVIQNLGHVFDKELLQVPVRSRGSDRDSLSCRHLGLDSLDKFQIVMALFRVARRYSRNIRLGRVLPVEVNAIQSMTCDEGDTSISKRVTVFGLDSVSKEQICGWLSREGPASVSSYSPLADSTYTYQPPKAMIRLGPWRALNCSNTSAYLPKLTPKPGVMSTNA
jgi:hypothetical protein